MLTGVVADISLLHIVLDVHGVGYLVAVRNPSSFTLQSTVTVHTYLAVRETALDLYGFTLLDELAMFELLLTIPKIGPKSAMQILSQAELSLLHEAVQKEDPTYLSKMSGIGKKTAEKIVVELRDKLDGHASLGPALTSGDTDVVDALVALGYPPKDAREVLAGLPDTIVGTNARIAEALRLLAQ